MSFSRRDALRIAVTGLGALPALTGRRAAQSPTFPPIPSWNTELRPLVPGVYAYTQATGPGVNNASLSNAGVIAGPDTLLAIDTLGPPVHARAFKAAAMKATGRTFRPRPQHAPSPRPHQRQLLLCSRRNRGARVHARRRHRAGHPCAPVRRPSRVADRHERASAGPAHNDLNRQHDLSLRRHDRRGHLDGPGAYVGRCRCLSAAAPHSLRRRRGLLLT